MGAVKAPQFGGAEHANGHYSRSRHRKSVFQVHGIDAKGDVIIRRQIKRATFWQAGAVLKRPYKL